MRRVTSMDASDVKNRAAQAHAFLDSARLHVGDSGADNSVAGTAAVHAGIAAPDAICGTTLGYRSRGENHDEAITLLGRALSDATPSRNLARLLNAKSAAGYSSEMLSGTRTADLIKYAERLVAAMDDLVR